MLAGEALLVGVPLTKWSDGHMLLLTKWSDGHMLLDALSNSDIPPGLVLLSSANPTTSPDPVATTPGGALHAPVQALPIVQADARKDGQHG